MVDRFKELLWHCMPFIKQNRTVELYHDSDYRLSLIGESDVLYVKLWNDKEQRNTCFKINDPDLFHSICNNAILKLDPNEDGWHIAGCRTVAS